MNLRSGIIRSRHFARSGQLGSHKQCALRFRLRLVGTLTFGFLFGLWLAPSSNPSFAKSDTNRSPNIARYEASDAPCPSRCKLWGTTSAKPDVLLMGETTNLEITVKGFCNPLQSRARLLFIVDPDEGMTRKDLGFLQDRLLKISDSLDLPNRPEYLLGLVEVRDRARVLVPLGNDIEQFQAGVRRLRLDSSQDLEAGLHAATRIYRHELPRDCDYSTQSKDFVFVFSSDSNSVECPRATKAANSLKRKGILVSAGNTTSKGRKPQCLLSIASSSRYYYSNDKLEEIKYMLDRSLMECLSGTGPYQTIVTESLAPGVEYIPDSAEPPAQISEDGRQLRWRLSSAYRNGRLLRYQIRPTKPGHYAVNLGTHAIGNEPDGRKIEATFPLAYVTVLGAPAIGNDRGPEPKPIELESVGAELPSENGGFER